MTNTSALDMAGRTCLITGATDGHGAAVARQLAARGADVVLLGRNRQKCEKVVTELAALQKRCGSPAAQPDFLLCDLSSRKEIERAAAEVLAGDRPLHVLVNNAGLVSLKRAESEDGHELTFAVNYLAMFQFTLLLMPRLRASAPSRIVNISSDTYRIGKLDLDNLALEPYSVSQAYARSKLAILYFTLELARRLEARGDAHISVNAADPGPVSSNIAANNPGVLYSLARPMIKYLFPSADRAARTAMLVATDPALADATGGYYRSRKHRENPLAFDAELSEGLWNVSRELTGADL
jgi:NAD(P)-dependent dehydrogenase (short-subunit alcohol dehydrogenase family)